MSSLETPVLLPRRRIRETARADLLLEHIILYHTKRVCLVLDLVKDDYHI
jgi:hypothetical protein